MRHVVIFTALMFAYVPHVFADGAFDSLDYCIKEKKQFNSGREAAEAKINEIQGMFSGWYRNPDTLPPDTLTDYRNAVRAYALTVWKDTGPGKGMIASWQTQDADVISKNFYQFIYPNEITADQEILLAKGLFKKDYEQNIKPKVDGEVQTAHATIDKNKQDLDGACKSDVVSQIFRATIGNLILTVGGNFEAAKRESGLGAQIVRATTGVSVTDILKYGIAGGKNSELNKINDTFNKALDNAGLGKSTVLGQLIQAVNPANIHVPDISIPKKVDTTVRIDQRTIPNVITNITGGIVKW